MTVTMIAARVNRGDSVHLEHGVKTVEDYETRPGTIVWTFTDGTPFYADPTREYRVDINI